MIYNNVLDTIGQTNLIKLSSFSNENNIFAKIEGNNPFGSVKDRVALEMINSGIKNNLINKDTWIIESTSGNTGIGLAGVCLAFNLKLIITMPENMSKERIDLMKSYKAEVVLTSQNLGMSGAIERAKEIASSHPNSFLTLQFENEANPLAHYKTTGPEIFNDFSHQNLSVDIFVSSIGSGGTITGTGKYLKGKYDAIKIIGVEPEESAVINGNSKGLHSIEGIGAGFIPKILDLSIVDETMTVSSKEAFEYCELLLKRETLFVGISSGAALAGVIKYIEKYNLKNKNIVVIFPDSGVKYISKFREVNND